MGKKYGKQKRDQMTCLYVFALLLVSVAVITFFTIFVFRVTKDEHVLDHSDDDGSDTHHVHGPLSKCPHVKYRSSDGSDHFSYRWRGIAGTRQGRYVQPGYFTSDYDDHGRPNPRKISNLLCKQPSGFPQDEHYTSAIWNFGQFVDHSITLTPESCGNAGGIHIDVSGDEYFDPHHNGLNMTAVHSDYHTDKQGYRHPINKVTHFVDGNILYGSTSDRTQYLRKFRHGLLDLDLVEGKGEYPPKNLEGFENLGGRYNTTLLGAGDIRANEQIPLLAWHTLFLREHNYQAKRLKAHHYDWDDECLFHAAKRIVVSEFQKVVFTEFIPSLLGHKLPEAKKYNPQVDPRIYAEFSTAAYRLHSLVNDKIDIHSPYTGEYKETIQLKDTFFNPSLLKEIGIDGLLLGLVKGHAEKIDLKLVDSLRQFLFANIGEKLDLVVLNIARGRELGLPTYSELRERFGLHKIHNWDDMPVDYDTKDKMKQLYGEKPDNVDAWVGMMAEKPHGGVHKLGPLVEKIIEDQFTRLRDGDSHYWEFDEDIDYEQKNYIYKSSLRDIILRNTEIRSDHLPKNIFLHK